MRWPTPLLFLLAALSIRAQTQCPPINFQQAGQAILENALRLATRVSGMQRVSDGSFTQQIFTGNVPAQQYSKVGTVTDFEQTFLTCVGLGPRTRNPGPPHIGTDQLGTNAASTVVTDLTGNGVGSFVFLSPYAATNQIVVGLVSPNITTASTALYTVGANAAGLVAGDFNGDGKHDVAVLYPGSMDGITPGGVSVLLGNGDGTLRPAVNYPAGNYSTAVTAYDFNGDGKTDLAVTNFNDSNVVVLLANPDGTFRPGVPYSLPSATYTLGYPNAIAAADVNGDGHADLVVATVLGVAILYGKGDGTFTSGPLLDLPLLLPLIATGDFNKDGNVDIAVTDFGTGTLYVLLGSGNGSFSSAAGYAVTQQNMVNATGSSPGNFFVEDFDGDGNPDLVFGSGHPDGLVPNTGFQTISVLYGNGDGSFAGPHFYVTDGVPTNVAVADFNGDGKPDLASAAIDGQIVSVLLGNGDGTFQTPLTTSLPSAYATFVAAADVNQDGKADLVITDAENDYVYVLLGNGDGTFLPPQSFPAGLDPSFVAIGDFNRDGKPDLAVIGGASLSILLGNGNGSFAAPAAVTAGSTPVYLAISDLNHDGNPDLIVANRGTISDNSDPGGVLTLLGNGNGTFQKPINNAAGINPTFVQTGDFNGDGKTDVIAVASDPSAPGFGNVLVSLLGNGDGTLQAGVLFPTEFGPSSVSAADFSGDGKQDLIVAHCCGDVATTYLLGNGDGTFQPEVEFSVIPAANTVVTDVNGDGKPDLAIATHGSGPGGDGVGAFLNVTTSPVPAFFTGEAALGSVVYYLQFPDSTVFGYYNFPSASIFYHYDMGFEAYIPGPAADIYLYDFTSGHWWYTSSTLFPYLYDFTLNTWIYYFPNTKDPGHYTTNPRYFSNLTTGKIFTM